MIAEVPNRDLFLFANNMIKEHLMNLADTYLSVYIVHESVSYLKICDHDQYSDNDAWNCQYTYFKERRCFYKQEHAYGKAYNTGDKTGNIFPDIDCMPDMDKEVSHKRQEYPVPEPE